VLKLKKKKIALYVICEDSAYFARAYKNATMNFGVYTECFARCAFEKFKKYDSEVFPQTFYEKLLHPLRVCPTYQKLS